MVVRYYCETLVDHGASRHGSMGEGIFVKRIAILSDTHGLLRPEVIAQLERADVIVHAGDINTPSVADALAAYGPVHIVRGNNDKEWAQNLPDSLTFEVEGLGIFLVHKKQDVPPVLSGVDVVIYGHSHRYAMEEREGVLWLNPGSCGPRRFGQDITLAVMEVDKGRCQVKRVSIPHQAR